VEFSGDDSGGATPDPIPNSEVKSSSADGTAGATLWESRTSPGLFLNTQLEKSSWVFFCADSVDWVMAVCIKDDARVALTVSYLVNMAKSCDVWPCILEET
jgi:hypothetical protein